MKGTLALIQMFQRMGLWSPFAHKVMTQTDHKVYAEKHSSGAIIYGKKARSVRGNRLNGDHTRSPKERRLRRARHQARLLTIRNR